MSGDSQFQVDITADDGSAKGFASADKQAEKFAGAQEKRGRAAAKAEDGRRRARDQAEKESAERRAKTGLQAHGRGFAAAEKAFGGGAVSGAGRRLGEVLEAGTHVRSAFAAASEEGAGLAEKIGAVGVAAAGATGAVIGLAFGAAKLASSWVQGATALGRLSAGLGMSTDQIQRWQGAGERFGVDKDSMSSALGGIEDTANKARFGLDNRALAAANQMGVDLGSFRDKDGKVDVDGLAATLADKIAGQKNPWVQKEIAGIFGISDAALPAFRQGSAALRSQQDDFSKYGGMVSAEGVTLGTREYGKGVQLRQLGERGLQAAQEATARVGEGALDAALASGRGLADGSAGAVVAGSAGSFVGAVEHTFAPAVHLFQEGAHEISVSAGRLIAYLEGKGLTHMMAVGMTANAYAESGLRADRHQRGGPAQGLWQWEAARRHQFERMSGRRLDQAGWESQADYAVWELNHTERRARQKLAMARSFAESGAMGSLYYDRPKDAAGQAAARGAYAEQMGAGTFEHHHDVKVEIHDRRGASVTVASSTAGQSGAPAIGRASVGTGL